MNTAIRLPGWVDMNAPWVDVRRFGANILAPDNTAAIQAGIDAVSAAGGGTLLVPFLGSPFMMTGRLDGKSNVTILGTDHQSTTLKWADASNVAAHPYSGTETGVIYCREIDSFNVSNLGIDFNDADYNSQGNAVGFRVAACTGCNLTRVTLRNASRDNHLISGGSDHTVERCLSHGAGRTGFNAGDGPARCDWLNNRIVDANRKSLSGNAGLHVSTGTSIQIIGNHVTGQYTLENAIEPTNSSGRCNNNIVVGVKSGRTYNWLGGGSYEPKEFIGNQAINCQPYSAELTLGYWSVAAQRVNWVVDNFTSRGMRGWRNEAAGVPVVQLFGIAEAVLRGINISDAGSSVGRRVDAITFNSIQSLGRDILVADSCLNVANGGNSIWMADSQQWTRVSVRNCFCPGGYNFGNNSTATFQIDNYKQPMQTLTDAAEIAVNALEADQFTVTLGGNRTLVNPTNLSRGQRLTFHVTQDGEGSRELAYGSAYKLPGGTAPTLSTAAAAVDVLEFVAVDSATLRLTSFQADVK